MGIACSLLPLHSSKSACMQGNGIMLYSASTLLDRLAVCCQPGDLCSHVLSPQPLGHLGLQHPPPMAAYFLAHDPKPGLRALERVDRYSLPLAVLVEPGALPSGQFPEPGRQDL